MNLGDLGVLPEEKDFCGNCGCLSPKESEQTDNKEPHSCAFFPAAALQHLGCHPEIPVLAECPLNLRLSEVSKIEVLSVEDIANEMAGVKEFHNHQDNPMPERYWKLIAEAIHKALIERMKGK